MNLLAAIGRDSIKEDHSLTYAGLLGTSGQAEIDQDVQRLKDAGLITEVVAQYAKLLVNKPRNLTFPRKLR